uniref:Uncharacterized protein n=1 Tax=Enterococcus faecalis TaxID=1351 RepID=Q8KMU0_ENTFL|nr:hypothetical protein [Enterococcus faecalis]
MHYFSLFTSSRTSFCTYVTMIPTTMHSYAWLLTHRRSF